MTTTTDQTTSNRIDAAFSAMESQIAQRIAEGLTTVAKARTAGNELDMDIAEHAKFQGLKSVAQLDGRLSIDEAIAIYARLGETVSVFNAQPPHVKFVLTGIFQELLSARIADRK